MHSELQGGRIAAAVETFKNLAEIPAVSSAEIFKDAREEKTYDITLSLSARSYASKEKSTQQCHLKVCSGKVLSTSYSPAVDASADTVKASFSSLPGSKTQRNVILREFKSKEGKAERYVELWRGERRFKCVDVTERHGSFITHKNYGSMAIHDDKILYSAEANLPSKEVNISSRKDGEWLSDWNYQPGLGEQTGSMMQPTVFILHFQSDSNVDAQLSRLEYAKEGSDPVLSSSIFGQAVFSSTGKDIFLTAYPTLQDGRRLGIVACTNVPAVVYKASLGEGSDTKVTDKEDKTPTPCCIKEWTRLSLPGFSARSPRTRDAYDGCFWLQCEEGGAHRDCDALISSSGQDRVDEIPIQSVIDHSTGWAGLYCDPQLPRGCLLKKCNGIVTDTIWGSSKAVVFHKFGSTSSPQNLTPLSDAIDLDQTQKEKGLVWSYKMLCTDGEDTIVAVRSSPFHPDQVLLGTIDQDGNKAKWSIVHKLATQWEEDNDFQSLAGLQCTVEEIPSTKSTIEGDVPVQTIILRKAGSSTPGPCILMPHGGPHSSFTTDWMPGVAALCLQGYTIALPNYHGSLGRGQQFAHSLMGQCSRRDVDDCVACVQYLISQGVADDKKLFVSGGSHGGFLTTHLIGKYPKMFQRAVVRNPVISVGKMEATTDIPNWCYSEFGLPFPFQDSPPTFCPSTEQYETMQFNSPIYQIDSIQTPILILVGLKDQRVPPAQSKLLYHHLLANKIDVRMLAFQDEQHSLDGVESELISWEASLRWFQI